VTAEIGHLDARVHGLFVPPQQALHLHLHLHVGCNRVGNRARDRHQHPEIGGEIGEVRGQQHCQRGLTSGVSSITFTAVFRNLWIQGRSANDMHERPGQSQCQRQAHGKSGSGTGIGRGALPFAADILEGRSQPMRPAARAKPLLGTILVGNFGRTFFFRCAYYHLRCGSGASGCK